MRVDFPNILDGSHPHPGVPDFINLFLTGPIDNALATEMCRNLTEIEAKNRMTGYTVPIQLYINTPGGDLYATWMISDIMSTMKTPIQTIGLGQVASGGFLIFMNGTKGMRIATTNTQFMSHQFSMANEATHANIVSQRPEVDRTHNRIINHYRKCTGLSIKVIEKYLLPDNHDVWLTADECKEYGVCDTVVDTTGIPPKSQRRRIKVIDEPEQPKSKSKSKPK